MADEFRDFYQFTVTFDLATSIVICTTVTFLFCILYLLLHCLLFWFNIRTTPRYQPDVEEGVLHPAYTLSDQSDHAAIIQELIHNSLHAWIIMGEFEEDFDSKRGQKLRDSKKLPPMVNYGSHDYEMRSCSGDCAICLEDFEDGELCQVFPACNHIFHSDCIDSWLASKLTCPTCRTSLQD